MNRLQLEQIINEYGDKVYSFCVYLTKNRSEADDLYQDTFLKAIELNEIDYSNNPKSYLLGIAINIWRNKRRRILLFNKKVMQLKISHDNTEEDENGFDYPETAAEKDEIKSRVHTAINSLPDKYRIIILMYYMEELSVTQIAEIVKIPQGTVKSRLYKARKMLEKQLEDLI